MHTIGRAGVVLALMCAAATPGCAATGAADQAAGLAAAAGRDVIVDHLDNGATVIVKPSRSSPVVTVRGYVRAGGLYEGEFLGCGISHLTEHLVAMGAEHLMEGQAPGTAETAATAPDRVRQVGGQANAYTSMDHTCYYISAEASKVFDCIDLITDWLVHPEISQADFNREHGVVQRELEMGEDDPHRQLWYAHCEDLFATHPAAVRVIGYVEPLSKLTFADFQTYHDRMYVPQNMIFVVVGDVDGQAVVAHFHKVLGDVPRGRAVELDLPPVPPVTGVRRRTAVLPTLKETLESTSFQTIPLVHEDLYALDLLSYVLTAGPASRLVQRIQRDRQLVTSISSSSWTPSWGKGAFTISFDCTDGKADAAEQAMLSELKALTDGGVTRQELARAKRQKLADWVYSQESVESQGSTLGSDYLSTEDVLFSASYTQRIQAVTAEQVRQAAKRYLRPGDMVVTRLVPAIQTPATGPAPPAAALAPAEVFTLPNGLRVILQPIPPTGGKGLVSMALVCEGGLLLEEADTNGVGSLMMALSTKGAGNLSAEDIAAFFDNAGGSITAECGNNTFYWQATVLDDSFRRALEILALVVQKPTFSEKELGILRPLQLAAIDRIDQEWQSQLNAYFRKEFFRGSPYAMLPVGSRDVVASATRQQIIDYHARNIRAGSSVLAIFGNFDPAAARPAVERAFASLPPGRVSVKVAASRQVAAGGEQHLLQADKPVAGIIVAAPGMKISDTDDRQAMDVLDTIISGYRLPSGWLHNELRGKQLVYMVHAYNWAGLSPGAFITIAACQPDKAGGVIDIINRDLAKAATYLPTDKEVDEAVSTILTADLLENQSVASLALSSALDELYGLGYDWRWRMTDRYRAIKPADVKAVGGKYLGDGLVTVVVSPLGEQSLQPPAATQPAAPAPSAGAGETPNIAPATQPAQ